MLKPPTNKYADRRKTSRFGKTINNHIASITMKRNPIP